MRDDQFRTSDLPDESKEHKLPENKDYIAEDHQKKPSEVEDKPRPE